MNSSFVISQGNYRNQLNKALSLLPFTLNRKEADFLLENNYSPRYDFLIIHPENSLGIKEIREMQKNLILKPAITNYKTVILNHAELLTIEAQNALLKSLEEPPEYLYIFLFVTDYQLLLPTIISRCQIVTLPLEKIDLDDNDMTYLTNLYNSLISASSSKKLIITENIFPNKNEALLFIEKSLLFWQQNLYSDILIKYSLDLQKKVKIIKNLGSAKINLLKNLNLTLTMDNFFLSLPNIN